MTTVDVSASKSKERSILRTINLILLVIALFITGYLAYTKLTDTTILCPAEGAGISCESVSASIYAYFPRGNGIPVAYLGFLTWVVIGGILLLEDRVAILREYGVLFLLGIALFSFFFHSYLTYTSITFIGAICSWCVTAHGLMTAFLIVQGIRAYRQFMARQ